MFHHAGPTFWELAEQCLSSTQRGYDLLAPKFDVTPFRTPDEILAGLARFLGPPRSIDTALDVCCGTGAAIQFLRPLVRKRVVGIDFSRGMLDVARSTFPDDGTQSPVELVEQDMLEMDFREEFDLAVTVGSLGHVLRQDEPRFVERIAAALKRGGRFALVTCEMPPLLSARYLISRSFNAAMHVRNTFKRPPFIMFYLRFLLPRAVELLETQGMDVVIRDDTFHGRFRPLKVVVATKR